MPLQHIQAPKAGQPIREGYLESLTAAVNRLGTPGTGVNVLAIGSGTFTRTTPPKPVFRIARTEDAIHHGELVLGGVTLLAESFKGVEDETTRDVRTVDCYNRYGLVLADQRIIVASFGGLVPGPGTGKYEIVGGWPNVYLGVTDDPIIVSGEGTVSIYGGSPATDTGENVEATNWFGDVTAGINVHVIWNTSTAKYEITAAQC